MTAGFSFASSSKDRVTQGDIPVPVPSDTGSPTDPQMSNYFIVLFYLLLGSMQLRQNTVITQSKQLEENAAIQDRLNKANAAITFAQLPPNANTADMERVQVANTEAAARREDIQNSLITARQNAQIMMTEASTNVSLLQQDAAQDAGWLQALYTIFQVVNQMSGGNN